VFRTIASATEAPPDGAVKERRPKDPTLREEHRQARKAARAEAVDEARRQPRAERDEPAERDAAATAEGTIAVAQDPGAESESQTAEDEPNAVMVAGLEKEKRANRTAERAKNLEEAALAATDSLEPHPALGALNRHLAMMSQQLTASQQAIGRLAAERDALRFQVAELQGIPVSEVRVSTIAGGAEGEHHRAGRAHAEEEPQSPSKLQRLNYFGVDDFDLMRKRRQRFVLVMALIGGVLALYGRSVGWTPPSDISRDSLSALPYLGNLMTVFLAGWVFYRVIRVSSKGVRWVFPTEDKRRRRR
jgi:hypothetical protein